VAATGAAQFGSTAGRRVPQLQCPGPVDRGGGCGSWPSSLRGLHPSAAHSRMETSKIPRGTCVRTEQHHWSLDVGGLWQSFYRARGSCTRRIGPAGAAPVHVSTRIEHPLAQCGQSGGGPRKRPHSGVSPNPPSTWVEAGKKRRAAHRCRGVQRHDRGLSSAAAERRPSLTPRAVVSCRVSSARAGAASGTVTCRRCVGPWSNGRAALPRI